MATPPMILPSLFTSDYTTKTMRRITPRKLTSSSSSFSMTKQQITSTSKTSSTTSSHSTSTVHKSSISYPPVSTSSSSLLSSSLTNIATEQSSVTKRKPTPSAPVSQKTVSSTGHTTRSSVGTAELTSSMRDMRPDSAVLARRARGSQSESVTIMPSTSQTTTQKTSMKSHNTKPQTVHSTSKTPHNASKDNNNTSSLHSSTASGHHTSLVHSGGLISSTLAVTTPASPSWLEALLPGLSAEMRMIVVAGAGLGVLIVLLLFISICIGCRILGRKKRRAEEDDLPMHVFARGQRSSSFFQQSFSESRSPVNSLNPGRTSRHGTGGSNMNQLLQRYNLEPSIFTAGPETPDPYSTDRPSLSYAPNSLRMNKPLQHGGGMNESWSDEQLNSMTPLQPSSTPETRDVRPKSYGGRDRDSKVFAVYQNKFFV